jgi:hypothetical protein
MYDDPPPPIPPIPPPDGTSSTTRDDGVGRFALRPSPAPPTILPSLSPVASYPAIVVVVVVVVVVDRMQSRDETLSLHCDVDASAVRGMSRIDDATTHMTSSIDLGRCDDDDDDDETHNNQPNKRGNDGEWTGVGARPLGNAGGGCIRSFWDSRVGRGENIK